MSRREEKRADQSHILVVDDDQRIRALVSRYLQSNGFVALTAKNAQDARGILERFQFDAMVLDVMMPDETGVEFTRSLRNKDIQIPVLLLTALSEVDDRVDGLEAGADDYLAKPFEPKELVLRLNAILKRVKRVKSTDSIHMIGSWQFDPKHDELVNGDNVVNLTSVEANLLRALSDSSNEVVSREDLAKRCGLDAGERTIDVQVTRLRKKIEENTKSPRYLQTVRGKGYLLRAVKE